MAHTVRKRSVTQWHYMAHTVWPPVLTTKRQRWEEELYGTHCVF